MGEPPRVLCRSDGAGPRVWTGSPIWLMLSERGGQRLPEACIDTVSEYSDIPEGVSTLRHYLLTLWRRKWLVLAPAIALPLLVFAASTRQSQEYEVFAEVLVNPQEVATTSLIGQTPAVDDPGRTMGTNAQLARIPTLLTRVLRAEGLDEPASVFAANSFVYPVDNVLRFGVDDREPSRAATLANEYARQFVAYRRQLDSTGLSRTLQGLRSRLSTLESQGKAASALFARLADQQQQLESILALRLSNVSVVRTAGAADATQIAPRPLRNTALALVGGLVIGLVLAFLAETLSTKPRTAEEIEARLGVPFLARLRREPEAAFGADGPVSDAFHLLGTTFELENRRVGARTVLVTDIDDAHGRSSAVACLGLALARRGRRVALVDLDLRTGGLTRLFGFDKGRGVTSLTEASAELDAAVVSVVADRSDNRVSGAARSLDVLGSGPLPTSPMETLGSPVIAATLKELADRSDLVLVDAPSVLRAPDANALSGLVDAALVVVGASDARRPALAEARRSLELWPAAKLGFALDERIEPKQRWRWRGDRASRRAITPVTTSEQPS